MYALLVLPILISGFICLILQPAEYWRLHRYDGQHLYLKAAEKGIRYFFFAAIISFYVKDFTIHISGKLPGYTCEVDEKKFSRSDLFTSSFFNLSFIDNCSYDGKADPALATAVGDKINVFAQSETNKKRDRNVEYAWVICVSVLSILSAYISSLLIILYGRLVNRTARKINPKYAGTNIYQLYKMSKILKGSPLDNLFFESIKSRKPVLISLNSRKVYVGLIISMGEPNESEGLGQEIVLLPVMSGYRDKDTLSIDFTNDYAGFQENEVNVVIDSSSIESASWFDFSCYGKVNKNKSKQENWKTKIPFFNKFVPTKPSRN